MPDLSAILKLVADAGVLGACVLIIWSLITERIVPRSRLDDVRRERSEELARQRQAMRDAVDNLTELLQRTDDHLDRNTDRIEAAITRLEAFIGRRR